MASVRLKLPVSGLHESKPGPLCVYFPNSYLTVSEFNSITSEFFTEYILFLSSTLGSKYYTINLLNKDLKFTQVL